MYRKYMVYIDDGTAVYKIAVPAENESDARDFVSGNGEVIAIKDITDSVSIDGDRVFKALKNGAFNDEAIDFMVRALRRVGVIE